MPANSNFWTATSIWKPSSPPEAPAKTPEPATVMAPPAPVVKVETTIAQPSDWRESWGKIPPPKPAPVHTEERVTIIAAPKVETTKAVPTVETTKAAPKVEITKAAPKVEITKAAPNVELPHAVVSEDDPL